MSDYDALPVCPGCMLRYVPSVADEGVCPACLVAHRWGVTITGHESVSDLVIEPGRTEVCPVCARSYTPQGTANGICQSCLVLVDAGQRFLVGLIDPTRSASGGWPPC